MDKSMYAAALDYLEHLRNRKYKESTLTQYHVDLTRAVEFFGAYKKLTELTPMMIRRFLDSDALLRGRRGQELAPRTISRTVRVLRLFLEWDQQNGWIDGKPLLEVFDGKPE